jgi:DNA-directed RNA polymerase subunit RPC12/RpoP
MTSDTHLDGNALGGLFHDLFGQEMTDRQGCCDACGTVSVLGSVMVYRGAGDVLRCPGCGSVIMVIVSAPSGRRVNFESMRWLSLRSP